MATGCGLRTDDADGRREDDGRDLANRVPPVGFWVWTNKMCRKRSGRSLRSACVDKMRASARGGFGPPIALQSGCGLQNRAMQLHASLYCVGKRRRRRRQPAAAPWRRAALFVRMPLRSAAGLNVNRAIARRAGASPCEGPQLAQGSWQALRKLRPECGNGRLPNKLPLA